MRFSPVDRCAIHSIFSYYCADPPVYSSSPSWYFISIYSLYNPSMPGTELRVLEIASASSRPAERKKNPRSCNSSWRSAHHVKTGLKRLTQEPDARLSTAELDAAWSEPYGDFGRNERDIVPRKPHFSFVKLSPYLEGELTSLKMSRDAPAERHSPAIQEADTHMLRGRWRRVCSSNSPARTCLLPRPAAGQKQLVKVFEAFSVNCLPSCFLLSDRTFNARTKDITWLLCLYQKSLFCWCSM